MNKLVLVLLLSFGSVLNAANVEPIRDIACPDVWVGEVIPVISSATNIWGANAADRSQARTHLSKAGVIETVDAVPATTDKLVDDPLTVASECLIYKNLLVDGGQYFPPAPPVTYYPENGYIPASVF